MLEQEMEQINSLQDLLGKSVKMSKFEIARNFKDFCESTSLHGYNYLHMTTSITLKIFWSIVITTMTGTGIWFLVKNTNDYMTSSIVTNIESTSGQLTVSMNCKIVCTDNVQAYSSSTLLGCCFSIIDNM